MEEERTIGVAAIVPALLLYGRVLEQIPISEIKCIWFKYAHYNIIVLSRYRILICRYKYGDCDGKIIGNSTKGIFIGPSNHTSIAMWRGSHNYICPWRGPTLYHVLWWINMCVNQHKVHLLHIRYKSKTQSHIAQDYGWAVDVNIQAIIRSSIVQTYTVSMYTCDSEWMAHCHAQCVSVLFISLYYHVVNSLA